MCTDKLKTQAISTIIPPPLGRDAVGEAELELLSWLDSDEGRMSRGIKEVRYVATQQEADQGQVWPWREAWELMRVMTQSYSVSQPFEHQAQRRGGEPHGGVVLLTRTISLSLLRRLYRPSEIVRRRTRSKSRLSPR